MAQATAYKSVVKNAAYIFFIKLFPALASIAVLILYSRKLPQEDYGLYQDFWVKLLLLGTLAYAGLPVTIITYPAEVLKHFIQRINFRQGSLYAIWFLVCGITLVFFLQKHQLPIILSVAALALYVIHSVQEALIMACKRMNGLLLTNTIYGVFFLYLHIVMMENYKLSTLLGFLLGGMTLRAIVLSFLLSMYYRHIQASVPEGLNLSTVRRLWLHLGFYDLIQTSFRYIDKFILSAIIPAGLFAIYFNGSQSAEVPLLPYLLGAVANSVLIHLSSEHKNKAAGYKLLSVSGRLLSCIVFPLFFFLFFFSRELFLVIFTNRYIESVPVFMIALLVLPLRAYNYTTLLQHLHQGAAINKGAIFDLICAVALMYPLYRLLGLPGVALSIVVSTYIQVGYYIWHTRSILKVPISALLPLKTWLIQFMIFGALLYIVHWSTKGILNEKNALLLGFVSMVAVSIGSLYLTYRKTKELKVD